jgi:hypothetical protein
MSICKVIFFGHAMSKATQYVTNDAKVCVKFSKDGSKAIQSLLQNNGTWIMNL